jgi:hypothetical protein
LAGNSSNSKELFRIGTTTDIFSLLLSCIICYISLTLANPPKITVALEKRKESIASLDSRSSVGSIESRDSFATKLNRDSAMLMGDYDVDQNEDGMPSLKVIKKPHK